MIQLQNQKDQVNGFMLTTETDKQKEFAFHLQSFFDN